MPLSRYYIPICHFYVLINFLKIIIKLFLLNNHGTVLNPTNSKRFKLQSVKGRLKAIFYSSCRSVQ